ncbi:MAG: hypothetical protein N3I35_05600 [Clostridia bacterium]|nr:hypothetical protein [Clostridia bacterium]
MLNSKIEKFIVRRVLVLFFVLVIVDLVFLHHKWFILLGLILGSLFSVFKFSSTATMYMRFLGHHDKNTVIMRSILKYILNQLATVALLVVSILFNFYLFIGTTAGILLVPSVLFINALTEGFGITHNNFE